MNKIPKQSATIEEVVDFYRNSDAYRRLSGSSQKDYDNHLSAVLITEVEGKLLRAYRCKNLKVRHMTQAYEQWSQVGVRTANYRRSVFSAAWKYAMRHDVMIHNPIALIETLPDKSRKVIWNKSQVKEFLNVAYNDFRWRSIGLIVQMAYSWGQRIGDMRLLTWEPLDLEQCRLDLTQNKRSAEVHLPIPPELCKVLRQQKEDFGFQDYVAPRTIPKAGAYTPYTKYEISRLVNEILKEVNLPDELTAMDLRRTVITEMREAGVDLGGIMEVSGHQNPASVKPYMVNTYAGASKALEARKKNEK